MKYEWVDPRDRDNKLLHAVLELDGLVFGKESLVGIHEQIERQYNPSLVVCHQSGRVIGYKMGYESSRFQFYSWRGAVHPDFRGKGIASELMKLQHEWCISQGYKAVRTHTLNRWKDMLILDIKAGFKIIGTFVDSRGETKIVLEKRLIAL